MKYILMGIGIVALIALGYIVGFSIFLKFKWFGLIINVVIFGTIFGLAYKERPK